MKKLIGCCVFVLCVSVNVWAQPMPSLSMKDMMVSTLVDYGIRLYDRHNVTEAKAVFNHVLSYDPTNPWAQKYLAKINPQALRTDYKPLHTIQLPKNTTSIAPLQDDDSLQELQLRIEQKIQEINQLKEAMKSVDTQTNVAPPPSLDNSVEFNAYLNTLRQELNDLRTE